jgi:tryptophan-rich sensory protein
MRREQALKVVLALVGLLFSTLVYPMTMFLRQEPALAMMLSLYVTLGIFLLLAARKPLEHRSLIAFTAWSSFAHAGTMAVQAYLNIIPH